MTLFTMSNYLEMSTIHLKRLRRVLSFLCDYVQVTYPVQRYSFGHFGQHSSSHTRSQQIDRVHTDIVSIITVKVQLVSPSYDCKQIKTLFQCWSIVRG